MPELFAVTGRPVAHSLSPEIFRLLFRELGRDGLYTRLAADSAREAVETAREIGILGLNVTSPFKEEMTAVADKVDGPAAAIGAVNCLTLGREPGVSAHNTDHLGLIGALRSLGLPSPIHTAVILGTGGAARGAAFGLVKAGAEKVILAGRSPEKARAAARALGCDWASFAGLAQTLSAADVCVSCLPFPASRLLSTLPPNGCPVVDAHYAGAADGAEALQPPHPSPALRWLFHQAVPSFEIMTGTPVGESVRQKAWDEFASFRKPAKRDVALVGFMGAGKTTTGRELALLSGREFVDTDELVEEMAGTTVPEIFARRGETSFRTLEREAIEKLAAAGGRARVIAVGGGAVLDPANRRILSGIAHVVWLWAPAGIVVARFEAATRPVLDPGDPLGSAERTLAARRPAYFAAADLIVNSTGGGPGVAARRIKDEMDQAL